MYLIKFSYFISFLRTHSTMHFLSDFVVSTIRKTTIFASTMHLINIVLDMINILTKKTPPSYSRGGVVY